MAVHTFSTQEKKKPTDTALVKRIEAQCKREGRNFSALIVQLLREYENGKK